MSNNEKLLSHWDGSIENLQRLVRATGLPGEWRDLVPGQHQFRAEVGAQINWWASTKTLQIQGKQAAQKLLADALTRKIREYVELGLNATVGRTLE